MKKFRKTVIIMSTLVFITTLNIIARDKQDESPFKNLQVYPKDISNEKLDSDMHLFSRSLGVKCGFCHVKVEDKWDYASDKKKHKEEARSMMRMTIELNEKYFGVNYATARPADIAINCFTCHRGEEMPIVPWDTLNVKPKPKAEILQWHQ